MKADNPPFDASRDYGKYNDADWRKIENSLADIDLDDVNVSNPVANAETPLRVALQDIANYYAARSHLNPVTRSELVIWLRQAKATFEAARKNLWAVDLASNGTNITQRRRAGTIAGTADTALHEAIAMVRRRLGKLVIAGSGSSKNAERLHRKFWAELLQLWLALPMILSQRTHATLHAFLQASSAPIFPAETTPGALQAFIKDHYKPRQFRKRASR
jgi:hypothetical protein